MFMVTIDTFECIFTYSMWVPMSTNGTLVLMKINVL